MMIIYNRSLSQLVMDAVKETKQDGFTVFQNITGEGRTEPKHGTHIWPSLNNMLLIAAENTKVKLLTTKLKQIHEKHSDEGLKIILLKAESVM